MNYFKMLMDLIMYNEFTCALFFVAFVVVGVVFGLKVSKIQD